MPRGRRSSLLAALYPGRRSYGVLRGVGVRVVASPSRGFALETMAPRRADCAHLQDPGITETL